MVDSHVLALYRISYMWYTAVGALVTIGVSGLLTLAIGANDPTSVPPELLAPVIRKYIHPTAAMTNSPMTTASGGNQQQQQQMVQASHIKQQKAHVKNNESKL